MPQPDKQVEAYNTDQEFLGRILAAVERTRLNPDRDPRVEFGPDGSYAVAGRLKGSADTIGTKAAVHWQERTFGAAAQDAFAMNFNDLIRERSEPVLLDSNTIMIESEDEEAIGGLVEGLADLSFARGIQMADGETAILDTMPGFELVVTMKGIPIDAAENRFRPGNVLVGIPSSGLHSNGFSDARRLFEGEWPAEFRVPTRIYDEVLGVLRADIEIDGLCHVTGGGLSKLRTDGLEFRFTQTHLNGSADIFHELFERWLAEQGGTFSSGTESHWVDDRMHRKFNSGIGFVIGCPAESVPAIRKAIPDAEEVGRVQEGGGLVVIERSEYTHRKLVLGAQAA